MQSIVCRLAQLCCAVLLMTAFSGRICFAQGESSNSLFHYQTWFSYSGDHHIADSRFALHLEATLRIFDFDGGANQFLSRLGLLYDITKSRSIRAGGGYVFSRTAAGSSAVGLVTPEHRSWEQVTLRHKVNEVTLSHRLRVEQRWVGTNPQPGGENRTQDYSYSNRFRYALRAVVPLKWQSESKYYVAIQNEIMVNAGKNEPDTFDQNRLSAVLGYRTGKVGSLEAGYLLQTVNGNDGRQENRHIMQIHFRSDLGLKR